MTPPKPYGMIAVSIVTKSSVWQPTKQAKCCDLVGGVMTPPYAYHPYKLQFKVEKYFVAWYNGYDIEMKEINYAA